MASPRFSTYSAYLLLGLFTSLAIAQQPQPQADDQQDPEDRNHGVARISLMNGDVSVRRGDSGDFVAGQINAPLLAADSVQTGPSSRAEIQLDFANRVRLSSGAEVRMGDLRAGAFQVQIARGVATFTILKDSSAQIELSTPSASVHPLRRGEYRIAILEDGTTQITVRSGDAEIYTPQGSQRIGNGQTMLVRGSANDPEYQVIAAIGRDEWDTFNERRDRELEGSTAYQHVSTDIQGAEDLDPYGKWQQDPSYGDVWTPNVAADWAPYQSGRWAWGDYYGWSWVSSDPWGWAPYHYGNWFHASYGWSWYPGPYRSHSWYRPAVVGFFGFGGGSGFGIGFGFGNVGWVPLAPYEHFNRWWGGGYGRGYGGGINIVNNTNIYNTYRNARYSNGVSSVTAQQFQNGQFGRVSHPAAGQIQSAGMVRGQLPMTPGTANLRFNDRQTNVTSRSAAGSQQFVSRGGFNQVQRTPFDQQRQNMQRSFSQGGNQQMGNQGQAGRSSVQPQNGSGSSSSWQRFGNPNGTQASPGNSGGSFGRSNEGRSTFSQPQTPSRTSDWGRFGNPSNSGSGSQSQPTRPSATPNGSSGNYSRGMQGSPQQQNFTGRSNSSSGRSVQIAPPIVQQRPSQPVQNRQAAPSSRPAAPAQNHQPSTGQGRSSGGNNNGSRPSNTGGHR